MAAKILTTEPQADPLWYRILDRFGPATFGWIVVLSFAYFQGGAYLTSQIESNTLEKQTMAKFLEAQVEQATEQTAEIKRLVNETAINRDFQQVVMDKHDEQTKIQREIAENTGDTNARMRIAEECMSVIPDRYASMVAELKEINATLKANN